MLTHPTINQLRELKLDGMAGAFAELQTQDRAKDLGHAEWLAVPQCGHAPQLEDPASVAAALGDFLDERL